MKFRDHASKRTGVLPTDEEVNVVTGLLYDTDKTISVKKETTTNLPFNMNEIDCVLCNSVLHGVGFNSHLVDASLDEFNRVIRFGGFLYIGEIRQRDELEGRNYGASIAKYLWWGVRERGAKYLFEQLNRLLKALIKDEVYILMPTDMFFEDRDSFQLRLAKKGFEVIEVFSSDSCSSHALNVHHPTTGARLDYMYKKIKASIQ